jgi:hypothetical protein
MILVQNVLKETIKRETIFHIGFAIEVTLEIATGILGFFQVSPVRKWVKILDPTIWLQRHIKIDSLARMGGRIFHKGLSLFDLRLQAGYSALRPINHFDKRFDDFWESAQKPSISIVKDSTYLNWRYIECPVVNYEVYCMETSQGEIRGVIVLQQIRRNEIDYGYIADIISKTGDNEIIRTLLSFAVHRFRDTKMAAIVAWFSENSPLSRNLQQLGFKARPPSHYFIARSFNENLVSLASLKNIENWSYVFGDSDYLLAARQRS